MKKITTHVLLAVTALSLVGCAQKSESEKLRDDVNKAAKKLDREIQGVFK